MGQHVWRAFNHLRITRPGFLLHHTDVMHQPSPSRYQMAVCKAPLMPQQTKRILLILAASISLVAAVFASFMLLPAQIGHLSTWHLAAIVGLCVLPLLTAIAMSLDNTHRARRQAKSE